MSGAGVLFEQENPINFVVKQNVFPKQFWDTSALDQSDGSCK